MILYDDAKDIVIEAGKAISCKTEVVPTQELVGRVCARGVLAPIDIQPFDNSAMDGFALRLCDLGVNGGTLTKIGLIAAGDRVPQDEIKPGHCVEIMTGAPTPPGADAVVPIEMVEVSGDKVRFNARPKMGANIRRAGEDFKAGAQLLKEGQRIYPQHIMPLAALGIDKAEVYKPPRTFFLATGNELVDDLSQQLEPGQIYNSNLPYGVAALKAMEVECSVIQGGESLSDNRDRFIKLLKPIIEDQEPAIIISSGAVSAGRFDFIRDGLEQCGAEILFHRVKIKPGKPNLFARLPNGTLYFGLPGNPVATAVGLRFFVQPCISAMMGMEEEKPMLAKAITPFKKRHGLRMFLKARAESWEDGFLTVDFLEGQASFMVSPFLNMNCWAVAREDSEEISAGEIVELYSLYPHSGLL